MAKPKNRSSKNKGRRGDTRRSAREFFRGFVSSTRRGAPASQKTVAVVCLVLLLASAIAMGGAVKGRWFGIKPTSSTTSPAPQGTLTLSKEYIYSPGGTILATEEPPGGGGCTAPQSPGNSLVATATSGSAVHLTWNLSSGADHYEVQRKQSIGASWATVGTSTDGQFDDTVGVLADTTYLYQVLAVDASGLCPSVPSNVDIATTVTYSETVGSGTLIRAVHLTELRSAVNKVRIAAGLATFDWPDSSTPAGVATPAVGGAILKDQVQKLRNRLNEGRAVLGLPPQSFSNEPLTAGTKIYANHILELRQGVQ